MIISTIWLGCLVTSNAVAGHNTVSVQFLKDLELEVSKIEFRDYSIEEFGRSIRFAEIEKSASNELFLDMTCRETFPLSMMGAFQVLKNRIGREKSLLAILPTYLATSQPSAIQYGAIFTEISKCSEAGTFAILNRSIQSPLQAKANVAMLVSKIDYSHMYKWFQASESPVGCPTMMGFILERLILEAKQNRVEITQKMRNAQNSLALLPGAPQLAFLATAKPDDPMVREVIKCVFEDAEIDDGDIAVVASNHPVLVKKMLEAGELKLPDKLRTRLEKLVSKSITRLQPKS